MKTRWLVFVFTLCFGALSVTGLGKGQPADSNAMGSSSMAAEQGAISVLIFGATRNTGLEAAKILQGRGDKVTAFVRPTSDRTALEPLGVDYAEGDAMELATVEAAFAAGDYDAVITTIACFSCDPAPDYLGNKNIIDAAKAAGIKRLVLVTSIGAGDSKDAPPLPAKWFLRKVLPLKTQAEDHLKASGLDYTIVRPAALKSADPTGNGILTEDRSATGVITRADLAALVVDCIDNDDTIGKTYAAIDSKMKWPWDMF